MQHTHTNRLRNHDKSKRHVRTVAKLRAALEAEERSTAAAARRSGGGGGGGGEEEDSVWTESSLGLPGTLAMWPGPVNHSVAVHEGGRERISLAFNLALVLK